MKTTVDLPEPLLREAQDLARRQDTTLKALIERGLRDAIVQQSRTEPFVLADKSVDGGGLQPAFRGASWDQVRDAIYGDPT